MGRLPMVRPGVGGQSWVVGKLESTGESAGTQASPVLRPPWQTFEPWQHPEGEHVQVPVWNPVQQAIGVLAAVHTAFAQSASVLHGPVLLAPVLHVLLQVGHDWMPGAFGKRSPPRKSSELSGRLRFEAPVEQSAVPTAFCDTVLMTHRLIGVVAVFGIGSGGADRHPTARPFRLLPRWGGGSWLR